MFVHAYVCECVCVCVCVYMLQVVHVEASMVHRWVVEFHRGAADWRPLGVTRDRACRLSKKDRKKKTTSLASCIISDSKEHINLIRGNI